MGQKVLAYGIIPLYTILFTRGYGWFTTNLSVIANYFDKKRAFFIWGLLVGGYYYWVHRRIREMSEQSPLCLKAIPGAILLLFCSITTPYLPEEMPLKADLHISLGGAALFVSACRCHRAACKGQTALPFISGDHNRDNPDIHISFGKGGNRLQRS